MPQWDTVAIVGVGLIGGSIGLALRRRGLAGRIVGIGRRAASLRQARQCQSVDTTTTNMAKGVEGADLVVVCTPVGRIVEHVQTVAQHCPAGALITDAGSTKLAIVEELEASSDSEAHFVGSHPLAGSEKAGPLSAREDLFDNRTVVVTPTRRTNAEAAANVEDFWKSLGAHVVTMSPRAHDEALAAVSHLPHLIAAALAGATPEKLLPLAATGWRDTTRVAAGEVEIWQDILLQNREPVLKSLDKLEKWLAKYRAALERGDRQQIAKLLLAGKQHRDALGN